MVRHEVSVGGMVGSAPVQRGSIPVPEDCPRATHEARRGCRETQSPFQ